MYCWSLRSINRCRYIDDTKDKTRLITTTVRAMDHTLWYNTRIFLAGTFSSHFIYVKLLKRNLKAQLLKSGVVTKLLNGKKY